VSRKIDLVTVAVAVVLHVGLAVTIIHGPDRARARPRPIEVEFKRPKPTPPSPLTAEPAPKPPEPTPRVVRRKLAMVVPTRAAPTPTPQPPARTAPAFGIAMESPTVASSPVSAPVGGSTLADPARPARPNQPAAFAGGPGGASNGGFASELEIKQMPEIDTDACGKTITYPEEAERNGIEGKVRLRVALDERGHVSGVRVLSGLGHGLDQAAVHALKHRCKFTPAIARDGRPVPFVVESYTFNFELPR
jgi:protein TonB